MLIASIPPIFDRTPGLSLADYLAHPGISSGALKLLGRSPAHYRAWLRSPREPTRSMILGSALHRLVEDPMLFLEDYVQRPEGLDGRTKGAKQWHADQGAKTVLTAEEWHQVEGMANAIRTHSRASRLLRHGQAEQSVFWTDAETGIECKARPDFWNTRLGMLVDVKTVDDARQSAFQRTAINLEYHVQAGWYLAGTQAASFAWICVEREPPHGVAVYIAHTNLIHRGTELCRERLTLYHACQQADVWPCYAEEVRELNLPAWASG